MGTSKVAKKSLYEKTDRKLQRWSKTIGAIVAIIGALSGVMSWVYGQFQSVISRQINELRVEIQESSLKTEVQITRLELLNLIHNQPTNTTEIEKVAKHYFKDLNGDWYVTGIYSAWCNEYGGDPSIGVGGA